VVPLKTKQGQELVKAFQTILASGRKPSKLPTDQGTEFRNRVFQKFLRENKIEFLTVKSFLFFFIHLSTRLTILTLLTAIIS